MSKQIITTNRAIAQLLLLAIFILFGGSVFACQYHNGYGIGGSPFGGFGNFPGHNAGNANSMSGVPEQWLEVSAPAMIKAEIDEKVEFDVEYQVLADVSDIQLSIQIGREEFQTTISEPQVMANNTRQSFTVIPTKEGVFRMVVLANGKSGDEVKLKKKVIYLQVSEKA